MKIYGVNWMKKLYKKPTYFSFFPCGDLILFACSENDGFNTGTITVSGVEK